MQGLRLRQRLPVGKGSSDSVTRDVSDRPSRDHHVYPLKSASQWRIEELHGRGARKPVLHVRDAEEVEERSHVVPEKARSAARIPSNTLQGT